MFGARPFGPLGAGGDHTGSEQDMSEHQQQAQANEEPGFNGGRGAGLGSGPLGGASSSDDADSIYGRSDSTVDLGAGGARADGAAPADGAAQGDAGHERPADAEAPRPDVADLEAQIADLKQDLEEERLRHTAYVQNLQRRHNEDLSRAKSRAYRDFGLQMLSIKDFLEYAAMDNSGNFEAIKQGVNMTLNELVRVFSSMGIKEIECKVGDKLDISKHSAMQAAPTADVEPDTILEIFKKGYSFGDGVLRHCSVKVATAPKDAPNGSDPAQGGEPSGRPSGQ